MDTAHNGGHEGVTVDTRHVSGHKDVSVGRRMWGLSAGTKVFQVAQDFLFPCTIGQLDVSSPSNAEKNSGSKVNIRKARRRRKNFEKTIVIAPKMH